MPVTDERLYFRQLLAGRDFATDDDIARQMVNFVYLVGDRETGEAVIVDPAYGVRELVEIAGADGLVVVGALVTHYHPDHVGGSMMGWEIEGVAALLGLEGVDAPIHVNAAEARGVKLVTGASDSDLVVHEGGDVVTVGDVPITLVHTPGHTPGSQCFLVDGRLVAGDTLFLDGCGRTDLPGGDADEMYFSLTQRLASVPDDTMLYPGHQYSPESFATMGATRDAQLRVPPALARAVAHDVRRLIAGMEIRDGDLGTEPGRTLADELWRDLAIRYADDPTAPEPKGETDDLRPEELAPPTGRFVIVVDDDADEPVGCGAIRRHDDRDGRDQADVGAARRPAVAGWPG